LSKGSAGFKIIIILAVIIVIALVPWYFIITRNLDIDINLFERTPAQEEESTGPEASNPVVETPPPFVEPTPAPTPSVDDEQEHEQEYEPLIPLSETIADIANENPQLLKDRNTVASMHNAVAVSLTLYDGVTGEYYTYEYGYADIEGRRRVDADTKFRVASLAKLTTVICAMVLVDEGLLDLDADITIYMGYEVKNPNYQGTTITTRMLLQHTSSIFDSGVFQASRDRNTSESVRVLLERGTSFRRNQPGTQFEYSNFGYAVLGAICENVAGKTLDTFSREVIFDPLGIDAGYIPSKMRNTDNIAVIYNDRHEITRSVESQLETEESDILGHDLHLAQGNLTITVLDYARVLAMLGNGGALNGIRILSPEAVREIHITNVDGSTYQQGLGTRYSVGDFIQDEGFYWHTGSAYGTFAQYVYSGLANRGVVVVTTGATTGREPNGMVSVCSALSTLAWNAPGLINPDNEDFGDQNNDVDNDE